MARQRLCCDRPAFGVDKGQCPAPRHAAPFEIALDQPLAFGIQHKTLQCSQVECDQCGRGVARVDQVLQQRLLPALERFQQESPTQGLETALGLGTEGRLETGAFGHALVDRFGVHVLVQLHTDPCHPRQRLHRATHVVGHQEGEVGSAPVGRQPKADVHLAVFDQLDLGDEAELRHRLVEFRVHHRCQAGVHLHGTVGFDAVGGHGA